MRFWRQKPDPAGEPDSAPAAEERPCPSLGKVLEKLLRDEGHPRVLQLGPFSGRSAVYLAERGARVTVDELDLSTLQPRDDDIPPSLNLDHRDGAFDLVILWDSLDFVPKQSLAAAGRELQRVLAPDGWVLLLAGGDVGGQEVPAEPPTQFEIVGEGRIAVRKVAGVPARPRYQHPTRRLEQALAPLTVSGIHLQRSQVREFLLKKPA